MQVWWKNPRVIGVFAYWVFSVVRITLRLNFKADPAIDPHQPYLYAFWHGKQSIPGLFFATPQHTTPLCALVSPSRDGAMLAVFLNKMGVEVIRGSSRDSGTKALLQLKGLVERGYSVGFAVDGPIGPIYEVKPGIIFLAQKMGIKIVPVGSAASNFWTFNRAWDKFQLPKPFARVSLIGAAPISIAETEDIELACKRLKQLLEQADQQAKDLLEIG